MYRFISIILLVCLAGCEDHRVLNTPYKTTQILHPVAELAITDIYPDVRKDTTNSTMILNPRNKNEYILAFHQDLDLYGDDFNKYRTKLQFVTLNDQFKIQAHEALDMTKLVSFPQDHKGKLSTAQDPRLFYANNATYIIYNDSVTKTDYVREMFFGKINFDAPEPAIEELYPLEYKPAAARDQKNWTPFVHDGQIYFIYSVDPYIILRWDPEQKKAVEAFKQPKTFGAQWKHGIIRGGTPAMYVPELDAYLTFFHSSLPYKKYQPPFA